MAVAICSLLVLKQAAIKRQLESRKRLDNWQDKLWDNGKGVFFQTKIWVSKLQLGLLMDEGRLKIITR